jgi:hypothetical protein
MEWMPSISRKREEETIFARREGLWNANCSLRAIAFRVRMESPAQVNFLALLSLALNPGRIDFFSLAGRALFRAGSDPGFLAALLECSCLKPAAAPALAFLFPICLRISMGTFALFHAPGFRAFAGNARPLDAAGGSAFLRMAGGRRDFLWCGRLRLALFAGFSLTPARTVLFSEDALGFFFPIPISIVRGNVG